MSPSDPSQRSDHHPHAGPIVLENDPRNGCVGCGPGNDRGLRLAFRRSGDSVEADLHADPDWEGWPGRLHSGVLYTAMLETANWTIFGLRGRIGLPVTTGALDLRHWVATDTLLRLTGRLDTPDGDSPRARVEAHDAAGLVATLERAYILPTERVFLERMGYSTLPEAFKGLLGDE